MQVAIYYGPGRVLSEERPVPAIGPGEILVRIVANGVCGSDLMEWYLAPRAPLVLGHEPSGFVKEVGEGVTHLKAGDRVFMHHHVPCHVCHHCRSGNPVLCHQFHATHLDPGGYAQYARVPAPNVAQDVLLLPDAVSFAAATFIEPLGCAIRGAERARIAADDLVAIIGAGVSGLLFAFAARLRRAHGIVLIDLDPARRRHAEQLGFSTLPTIDPEAWQAQWGRLADVVVLCVGSAGALQASVGLLGAGGRLQVYAPPPPGHELRLDPSDIFLRELEVQATYSCGPTDTRAALTAIERGDVPLEDLITDIFALSDAGAAMARAGAGGESLKVLLHIAPEIDLFSGQRP